MGVSWTREQQQVIDLRKRNILVSAAAGSGKTAVLVERIIKMITEGEHPVDIDRLLVVTFTNAAAAEMRERIGAAIEKALEEHPDSEHLQRQLTLIHNAQITTIDSFCLYVIRNHFHEIDLEPDFRIGDEGELKLLKEDVLRGVLESNYEQMPPEFAAFAKGYVSGKSDAKVAEMILSLYEFSMSYPWPMEWLTSGIRGYEIPDVQGMAEAPWMQPLVLHLRSVLADLVKKLRIAHVLTLEEDGPDVYEKVIVSDLAKFEELAACENFLELYKKLTAVTYDRLPSSRGFSGDAGKLSRVKELRDQVKDTVKKINKQYFFASPEVMYEQVRRAERGVCSGKAPQESGGFSRSGAFRTGDSRGCKDKAGARGGGGVPRYVRGDHDRRVPGQQSCAGDASSGDLERGAWRVQSVHGGGRQAEHLPLPSGETGAFYGKIRHLHAGGKQYAAH